MKLDVSIVSPQFQKSFTKINKLLDSNEIKLATDECEKVLNNSQLRNPVDIKTFNYVKALILYKKSNVDSTLTIINNVRLIETPNTPKLNGVIFSLLGSIYTRKSDYNKALQNYLSALTINNLMKDTASMAANLGDIGLMYYYSGYLSKSFEYFKKSLILKQKLNDTEGYRKSQMNLALLLLELDRGKEAIIYIKEYLHHILGKKNHQTDEIICYFNLGLASYLDKSYDSSSYYLNYALKLSEKLQFNYGIAKVKYALAELNFEIGHYQEALKYAESAKSYNINSIEFWGYTNLILGHIKYKLKQPDYFKPFQIVLDSVNIRENLGLEKELYNKLILVSLDNKNYKDAYLYQIKLNEVNKKLNNNELNIQILELKVQSQLDEKEAKINEMKLNSKLNEEIVAKRNNLIYFLIGFIVIFLLAFIYIFYQNHKINNLNLKLQESNNTILKFFSIISHDLRSPVGSFKMILDELNNHYDDFSDEDRKKLINETAVETNNIIKLLENLLTWAKTSKGEFNLYFNDVNISNELNEVINSNQNKLKDKNIKIIKNFDNNLIAKVDKDIFNTLIRNILSNAIKFSKIDSEIEISASKSQTQTTIKIKDNGVGMSESQLNDLFQIDKKVTRTGTKMERGTGLGLIIVKELVDLMGAKIEIKSEQNIGTECSIILTN